jgi:hypothetical protein
MRKREVEGEERSEGGREEGREEANEGRKQKRKERMEGEREETMTQNPNCKLG